MPKFRFPNVAKGTTCQNAKQVEERAELFGDPVKQSAQSIEVDPIELDSNICICCNGPRWLRSVVSLAVMCSYGPVRLLGAFE